MEPVGIISNHRAMQFAIPLSVTFRSITFRHKQQGGIEAQVRHRIAEGTGANWSCSPNPLHADLSDEQAVVWALSIYTTVSCPAKARNPITRPMRAA
jgi:hypothetical protein